MFYFIKPFTNLTIQDGGHWLERNFAIKSQTFRILHCKTSCAVIAIKSGNFVVRFSNN